MVTDFVTLAGLLGVAAVFGAVACTRWCRSDRDD